MDERERAHASEPTSREELLRRVDRYAESVPLDVDTDRVAWQFSDRAKRRAGACLYDPDSETVTIRLAWAAYQAYDWETFAGVVRHELVHAWEFLRFGDSDHGTRFERVAREVDAPLSCPTFAEPRLRLVCTNPDCEWALDRHRASKTVTHPEGRRCGTCGARYRVRHVATGETWETHEGYATTRERIDESEERW